MQRPKRYSIESLEPRLLLTANELVPFSYALVRGGTTPAVAEPSSYNPAGGDIVAQSTDVGRYSVEFELLPGFTPVSGNGGNVQVTSQSTRGSHCNVASWGESAEGNLSARVVCFDTSGAPAHSDFSIAVLMPDAVTSFREAPVNEGQVYYAWADNPADEYTATPIYSSNNGNDVLVNRAAMGRYSVTFSELGGVEGGNVQVTAYGETNARCGVTSWSSGGSDFRANVHCTATDGSATDAPFSIAVIPGGTESSINYAWANDPEAEVYNPNTTFSRNASGGGITIDRSDVGRYRVSFPRSSESARVSKGHAQITSYDAETNCVMGALFADRIDVRCFDAAGAPADSLFSIMYLSPLDGDIFEPNDSFALATDLGTGSQEHEGLSILDCGGRAFCSVPDYYAWTAESDAVLTVGVDPADDGAALTFELYDAGGTRLTTAEADTVLETLEWSVTEDELYFIRVLNQLGMVNDDYTLTLNTEANLLGDIDMDGDIDADDIDRLFAVLRGTEASLGNTDLNGDSLTDNRDADQLVEEILNTAYGDANLNGDVQFSDFLILSANFGGDGGWAQGDFTGDGMVNFADFLLMSANFGFESAARLVEPESHSGIELSLNSLFYSPGDSLTVSLDFGDVPPPAETPQIILSSEDSGDVETISLRQEGPGRYVSINPITIRSPAGDSTPADGIFTPTSGEEFYAMFIPEASGLVGIEEDIVYDFAVMTRIPSDGSKLFIDGLIGSDASRFDDKTGTLGGRTGVVDIALQEVLLSTSDPTELEEFLDVSGGTLVETQSFDDGGPDIHLIRIELDPLSPAELENLEVLRELYGEEGDLVASSEGVLSVYYFVLLMRAEGFDVSVNPRLDFLAAPEVTLSEQNELNSGGTTTPTPAGCNLDPSVACVTDVSAVWAHTALWDFDTQRVPVAVLDYGFDTNADFRQPVDGVLHECNMTVSPPVCGPGAAQAIPDVPASGIGGFVWHGTGVASTIGGVVNNGFGAAGVGGQVVEPMLYRYDLGSYVFDIGAGIRRAVDDGAAAINISAGYPCRVLTNVGPDYNICSPTGRLGLATTVTAGIHAAAATVCAASGFIPLFGSIACGIATSAAAASTNAVVASLAFGEQQGPMERAVRYATNHGVPVVASAGNDIFSALPPAVRRFVDTSTVDLEDWMVIPAAIPSVIAVGSVDSELRSTNFNGDLVDTWAPTGSAYVAPSDVTDASSPLVTQFISGTSGAAPWVTGLIAVAQAINPELNPLDPRHDDIDLRRIVPAITRLITSDENSTSNTELVAMGLLDQPDRREIVNPLKVVEEASIGRIPNLTGLGYDDTLGFSELLSPNDTSDEAATLSFGTTATGTIVDLRPEGSVTPTKDIDWFEFTMPTEDPGTGLYHATLSIEHPSDDAFIQVVEGGDDFVLTSRGSSTNYTIGGQPGETVRFALGAVGDQDNVYKVTVNEPNFVKPRLEILGVVHDEAVCTDTEIHLTAELTHRAPFADREVEFDSEFQWWRDDRTIVGVGDSITVRSSAEPFEIDQFTVTVIGESSGTTALFDDVFFVTESCVSARPEVEIIAPPDGLRGMVNGSDENGQFRIVSFLGRATDAEDGVLPGNMLRWSTNRADTQVASLGTGVVVTVRLYAAEGVSTTRHRIRLTAIDSDGLESFEEIEVLIDQLL